MLGFAGFYGTSVLRNAKEFSKPHYRVELGASLSEKLNY